MCLIVLFPSTGLWICSRNKWFHNYFCYFWSPSQALRPWKKRKEKKRCKGENDRMGIWWRGGWCKGFVKGSECQLSRCLSPICLNPNISLAPLPAPPPIPRTHARTHKHAHPRCRSHVHSKQTGIASDTSSVRQLWDWARKPGLSLTANHSVCVYLHQ